MEQPSKPVPARRIQVVCLVVLTCIAVGATLQLLRAVLIPFVLALFLAIVLGPVVDAQVRRLRVPRAVAVTSTLLLGLFGLFLVGAVVSTSVRQLSTKADVYQARLEQLRVKARAYLPIDEILGRREGDGDAGGKTAPGEAREDAGDGDASGGGNGTAGEAEDGDVSAEPPEGGIFRNEIVVGVVRDTVESLASLLSQGVLVLIYLAFLLAGRRPVHGIGWEIEESIKLYVTTKFLVSALTGVFVGTIYVLLGVDLAIVFGLLAFLLNFIPNIGSLIAVLLPLPVIILSPTMEPLAAVLAIALPIVVNTLVGNVLEPHLMGKAMDLHPIAVLLALIFWGYLWGIIGMLLAVPMTVCARMLMERLDVTAPVARLMAGRLGT